MGKTFFWDVDTQYDFIKPDGKLYVPGAEETIPNLAQLTLFARYHGIRVLGTIDWHQGTDPEISSEPDFKMTFPEHCIQGSEGSRKIPETEPENPLWIEPERYLWKELERNIRTHPGEIFFRKHALDVFSNENIPSALDILDPTDMVVYGMALEFCVAYSIEGFLKRPKFNVILVEDATRAISDEHRDELIHRWRSQGVRIAKTTDILKEL
jgi:nicotinamidase-related amidase